MLKHHKFQHDFQFFDPIMMAYWPHLYIWMVDLWPHQTFTFSIEKHQALKDTKHYIHSQNSNTWLPKLKNKLYILIKLFKSASLLALYSFAYEHNRWVVMRCQHNANIELHVLRIFSNTTFWIKIILRYI